MGERRGRERERERAKPFWLKPFWLKRGAFLWRAEVFWRGRCSTLGRGLESHRPQSFPAKTGAEAKEPVCAYAPRAGCAGNIRLLPVCALGGEKHHIAQGRSDGIAPAGGRASSRRAGGTKYHSLDAVGGTLRGNTSTQGTSMATAPPKTSPTN